MGLLDGDIRDIVGGALVDAGLSIPITLTKVIQTPRDPAHPTVGTTPTTVDHACQGFVANTSYYQFRGTLIANANRVIKIYGSTLPSGVIPAAGDRVTAAGKTSTVVNSQGGLQAVTIDPAGAVWVVQVT